MTLVTLPMHREPRPVVGLADILTAIPENGWTWSVLEFWGIGNVAGGMPEFEERVRSGGMDLSWPELLQFAEGLDQTIECLIVEKSPESRVATIEADDSTTWRVTLEVDLEGALEALDEFR